MVNHSVNYVYSHRTMCHSSTHFSTLLQSSTLCNPLNSRAIDSSTRTIDDSQHAQPAAHASRILSETQPATSRTRSLYYTRVYIIYCLQNTHTRTHSVCLFSLSLCLSLPSSILCLVRCRRPSIANNTQNIEKSKPIKLYPPSPPLLCARNRSHRSAADC